VSDLPSAAFDHYFAMWNETDPDRARAHLDQAVTEDFEFCDPLHHHTGRDALFANVVSVQADFPGARFMVASRVDSHHDRHRYHWVMLSADGTLIVQGFDVATVAENGLFERIDGFFGDLPLEPTG
jgi:hypothetical protein